VSKFKRVRPNGVREKRYKFLNPSLFWAQQGEHLGQITRVWVVMYSKAPSPICEISSRLTTRLRDIILLPAALRKAQRDGI